MIQINRCKKLSSGCLIQTVLTLFDISCSFIERNNKSFDGEFSRFKPCHDKSLVVPVFPNQSVCLDKLYCACLDQKVQ